ncbi:MAG: hypothetical protein FWC43_05635 [Planctomycetaceae bacterium]|nr:hypothetical protein [Planctomycetaceae bacterium]
MKYNLATLVLAALTLFCGTPNRVPALEADRVYPDSTKGFFSISDVERLADQWKETQLGTLMQQPEMKEFWVDLRRQLGSRLSSRFSLTLDDLRLIPTGEVAGGMIAPVGQMPGFILYIEVSGRISETEDFLKALEKKFEQKKATKSTLPIGGENASVFTFAGTEEDLSERQAVYLLTQDHLLISDQVYLVDLISKRLKGDRNNSLADVPAYTEVMKRCAADLKENDTEPVIRWYVQPLELGEAIRATANLPEKGKAKTSPFKMLAEVGFDAILGIGGTVDLKADELEVVHRTFIYAPRPYRYSMNMLAFCNDTNFELPHWVPEEIAGTTTLYVDPLEMFDHFGPLFDAMFVPGDRSAWEDIIDGMKNDPHGLQIDIREELVQLLGHKILFFTQYTKPITTDSENLFVAVAIQEGKTAEVQQALGKLIPEEDPDFERRLFEDHLFWQKRAYLEAEQRPSISIGGTMPPLPGTKPVANKKIELEETKEEQFFPKGAITVAFDHILFSSNVEYLEQILTQGKQEGILESALEKTKDYESIFEEFQSGELGHGPRFLQSFSRSAEAMRPTYEMIRQGKMPQSKSVLGRVLNLLLTPPEMEDEIRPTRIDGSKMPEFETIQQYFGPSGLLSVTEENGWFFKGFSLKQPE